MELPADVQGLINALAQQRNAALDQAAQLAGMVADRDKRIANLEDQLADSAGST